MQNNFEAVVLDTSFISALYKIDDDLHDQAIELYRKQVQGRDLLIPITVLLELSLLTESYNNFTDFRSFLDDINYKTYYLDAFFEKELDDYLNSTAKTKTLKLKAIDLSVLLAALNSNADLITFDKKLAKSYYERKSLLSNGNY